jgi:chromate transporter
MKSAAHSHGNSIQSPIPFSLALRFWLKLGFISFGGPAGQIATMHMELVERRRWISEARFLHALNYCMVLPGPEATQLAIYIGWLMHRTVGGIVAGMLFILPSLLILIALSWIYMTFGNVPIVMGILYGIKPAVVAIIFAAAWRIGLRTLKNAVLLAIAIAAFVAITVAHVPFPAIIVIAALCGATGGHFLPTKFASSHATNVNAAHDFGPAVIDDDTPPPPHARLSSRKVTAIAMSGVLLGLATWYAVATVCGYTSPLAQMAIFFSKAALVTFGGAYAVLPYVVQGAVDQAHWLQPSQMIDGLALGETTPGPLIMVVAFVGFVGAWQTATAAPLITAIAGACIATLFTFLPSFIFVLAGAPLIESTRDNVRLTAPLTAISAAVVGVIVSLAIFFATNIFRLTQSLANWDFAAMIITILAVIALMRFGLGTIKLIFACAIAGVVVSFIH